MSSIPGTLLPIGSYNCGVRLLANRVSTGYVIVMGTIYLAVNSAMAAYLGRLSLRSFEVYVPCGAMFGFLMGVTRPMQERIDETIDRLSKNRRRSRKST